MGIEPRIAPGTREDLGLVIWTLCRALSLVTGKRDIHLFSTMGRRRGLFRGWLHFASGMMPGGSLPRFETELCILRVAHVRRCQYELDHHIALGRHAGVGPEDLERVRVGPSAEGWSPRQRALLSAVDALLHEKDIDDARWAALRVHFSEPEAIELCLLIGHYEMLATFIATLRIAPDRRR